jgi:hypothetical protein
MTDPLVRRALLMPQVAHFRRWSILPMASVTRTRCAARIDFQDARFGRRAARGRLGQSVTLPTHAPGC